jgi:hypothetical protein
MAAPGRFVELGHISEAECIGYWPLNEPSGTRIARLGSTISPTGLNGITLTQAGTVTQGTRTLGFSANFDGNIANHLTAPFSVDGTKGLWVSALVKPELLGTAQTFVSAYDSLSNGFFTLEISPENKARFLLRGSGGSLVGIASTASLAINTWYLLQAWIEQRPASPAIWDIVLQIDGNVAESGATTGVTWGAGTAPIMIGRRQTTGGELPLTGEVAEVRVSNRTPTLTERSLLHQITQRRQHIHSIIPAGPTNVRGRLMRGAQCLIGTALDEGAGGIATRSRVDTESAGYGNHANMVQFYRSSPKPELLTTAQNQGAQNWRFREAGFTASYSTGAVPVLTLEFFYYNNSGVQTWIELEQFMDGTYDEFLLLYCNELRKMGKPVILRIFHEMDLRAAYKWAGAADNANSPRRVVAAWKYVVRFMREELAEGGSTDFENVWFAYCPNRNPSPGLGTFPWNTLANYWVGAGWLDIVGTDGYNFVPDYNAAPVQMVEGQQPNLNLLKALVNIAVVPFIIFETNTKDTGQEWVDWMTRGAEDCIREGLCGFFIFDVPSKNWFMLDGILTNPALLFKRNGQLSPLK